MSKLKSKSKNFSEYQTPKQKAVCYVRVSTLEQANLGVSLDAQEEKIKAYCLINDLEITEIIREEGVSGGKEFSSRPGGSRLMEIIKKKQAQNIVTLKLDRLFRDAADALNQTKNWDKLGIALHVIDMGGTSINTSTATGRLFLTMSVAFAEMELNLIRERTALGMQYKKSKREVYSPTPFGFQEKLTKEGKMLVQDKQEQEVLLLIKKWHSKGWSLRKIANELTVKGVATKQGGKWYASTIKYLLENDLYQS
jgi:DNA invertase Pin-like site-specific DNA recombinase